MHCFYPEEFLDTIIENTRKTNVRLTLNLPMQGRDYKHRLAIYSLKPKFYFLETAPIVEIADKSQIEDINKNITILHEKYSLDDFLSQNSGLKYLPRIPFYRISDRISSAYFLKARNSISQTVISSFYKLISECGDIQRMRYKRLEEKYAIENLLTEITYFKPRFAVIINGDKIDHLIQAESLFQEKIRPLPKEIYKLYYYLHTYIILTQTTKNETALINQTSTFLKEL
jgi:hypothetical protein